MRASSAAPAPAQRTAPAAAPASPTSASPTTFASFQLAPAVARGVLEAGFLEPRPIQAAAIPSALEGRDILGLAQTGTGKTAAFGIPILNRLVTHRSDRRRGPRALIIAPTRELARQIHDELQLVGHHTGVRSTVIFGGVPQGAQVRALKQAPEIVVACPGRLLDLHGQRLIDLSSVEMLVLDEADHMFDMGFLPFIRKILALLPRERQNMFFSATMPREIRGLADDLLTKPVTCELSKSRPADTIEDTLFEVAQDRRLTLLTKLLAAPDFRSAIVFLRTKHRARRVAKQLEGTGYRAVALQGNMSQGQRERAMEGFRKGQYNVLVATDIAARGIDVAAVSHVVNFDVPNTPEAYTHRIGRTGRAELTGKAYTFASREDDDEIRAIEKHLGRKIQRQSLAGFDGGDLAASSSTGDRRDRGSSGGGRSGGRSGGGGQGGGRRPSAGGGPRAGGGRPPAGNGGRPTGFPRPAASHSTARPSHQGAPQHAPAAKPAARPAAETRGSSALPFGAVVDSNLPKPRLRR
ncbi:MAG: DEAD/DEAH box helicase [Planctomycetota bacterium]